MSKTSLYLRKKPSGVVLIEDWIDFMRGNGQIDGLLTRLVDFVYEEMACEFALTTLFNRRGEKIFEQVKNRNYFDCLDELKGISSEAFESGLPVERLVNKRAFFNGSRCLFSVHDEADALCLLAFPLTNGKRPQGAVAIGRSNQNGAFSSDELEFVARTLALARPWLDKEDAPDMMPAVIENRFIGQSSTAVSLRALLEKISQNDVPVLITGESGTGKELAARTIHDRSRRGKGPFVAVNCGAIPETLLESELFGYARGAFTGAFRDKPGLIEEASGGTFFLDEVGDLALALQAKLLRVLEEKKVRRVGDTKTRPVDARIISATNKNLEQEVAMGHFRQDLYYRLKIICLELPPLRERKEDIRPLLAHFLRVYARNSDGCPLPHFSPGAIKLLEAYSWPGNVRELQNEVQRCLVLAGENMVIDEDLLSVKINLLGEKRTSGPVLFSEARSEFEKKFIHEALERFGFNRTRTAEEIGLSRQGLFKLMKKHQLC